MVADLLGSLSFEVSDERAFSDASAFHEHAVDFHEPGQADGDEAVPFFVRGSVLDAFVASGRVERAALSSHIAAIDSDDNGLYRLYPTR